VVELTILAVLGVLAVEPEHIDGEAEVGEVVGSVSDLLGRVVLPLGEVVTERVHRWHGSVAGKLGKLLLEFLGVALGTQEVELKSVALRDESVVGLLAMMGMVHEDESFS
jgi:hypothetical protein